MVTVGRRRGFVTFAAAAIALMQVSPKLTILDGFCSVLLAPWRMSVVGSLRSGRGCGRRSEWPVFWDEVLVMLWVLSPHNPLLGCQSRIPSYFLHGCMS